MMINLQFKNGEPVLNITVLDNSKEISEQILKSFMEQLINKGISVHMLGGCAHLSSPEKNTTHYVIRIKKE